MRIVPPIEKFELFTTENTPSILNELPITHGD
jgi:hypothetical protein